MITTDRSCIIYDLTIDECDHLLSRLMDRFSTARRASGGMVRLVVTDTGITVMSGYNSSSKPGEVGCWYPKVTMMEWSEFK